MDRLFLILEVLESRGQSHLILADMLEEEGEPELAARCRVRKFTDLKMLNHGLELLPFPIAMHVVTEFSLQAFSFGEPDEKVNECLASLTSQSNEFHQSNDYSKLAVELENAQQFFDKLDLNKLQATLVGNSYSEDFPAYLNSGFQAWKPDFVGMLQEASVILRFQQSGDFQELSEARNSFRTLAQRLANHTRQLPRNIRTFIQETEDEFDHETETWKRLPYTVEQLAWQLECLRKTVERFCEQSKEA